MKKDYIFLHDDIQHGYTFMIKNVPQLGSRENEFLMQCASTGKNIFSIGDVVAFWRSAHNARIAIHRLVKKEWIRKIEKGKYVLIPFEAGKARNWAVDSFLIAQALIHPAVIAYWSAMHHWNWTEQIPRIVYVQTTKRKSVKRKNVFGVEYEFVTVQKNKFYGQQPFWRGETSLLITDKEKTLIDCADDPERAGGIDELLKAIRVSAREIDWVKLHAYARRFPNRAVMKRLGYLFEKEIQNLTPQSRKILEDWKTRLSNGIALLQPDGRNTGRIVTRWRLRVNV